MKGFLAGLLAGLALAASTVALAGGRSTTVVPATAGERQIVQKLIVTNRLLALIALHEPDMSDVQDIRLYTEKSCAYLRSLVYRTSPTSTCS